MQVIENENVVTVDVDDTLVLWNQDLYAEYITIQGPYTQQEYQLAKHSAHIDLIKQYKVRGFAVVVWSAAGYQWARKVVQALELEPYVDLVMTKPSRYVDDLPCNEWMGNRIYVGHR